MQSSTLSLTLALDGVGGQRHSSAALPLEKTRYQLCWSLGGSQRQSGRLRKISPPPGFDPRTVQAVASQYADYNIPAYPTPWILIFIYCGYESIIVCRKIFLCLKLGILFVCVCFYSVKYSPHRRMFGACTCMSQASLGLSLFPYIRVYIPINPFKDKG